MKGKNLLISSLACLTAMVSVFSFVSCGKKTTATSKATVVNGYETYEDLNATSIRAWAQGSLELNTDKKYVTQGNASAYFSLTQWSERAESQVYPWVSLFKYETGGYEALRFIDKIESFSFDIYNVDDKDYQIYLSAIGDAGYVYNSNAATLVANSWNAISFDMKPWFYEKDTYVKEYVFYVTGIEETAHFYMDNVRITEYDGNAPTYEKKIEEGFEEQELLSFAGADDLQFIQTECGSGGDVSEVVRLMGVSYVSNIQIGNCYSAMRVTFDRCLLNGWLWAKVTPHTLKVDPRALTNVQNAKSIGIQCFNSNSMEHIVTLEIAGGGRTASKRVRIAPMQSETLTVASLSDIDNIENIYIRIDAWNVTSAQTLYFSDLSFTI